MIRGVPLPGTTETSKVSLYADDSTATLIDLESVDIVLKTSQLYGRASGAKLNVSKTKAVFLGKWKSRSDHPLGFPG